MTDTKKARIEGRKERGAAMVEFAFVLPIMLILVASVYTLGNAISQMTWVINTTYTAAIAGASSPSEGREDAIRERAYYVASIIDRDEKKLYGRSQIGEYTPANPSNPASVRTVMAEMSGHFWALKGLIPLDDRLVTQLVAPVLVNDSPEGLDNFFQDWGNAIDPELGTEVFRDCAGDEVPTAENEDCINDSGSMFYPPPLEP